MNRCVPDASPSPEGERARPEASPGRDPLKPTGWERFPAPRFRGEPLNDRLDVAPPKRRTSWKAAAHRLLVGAAGSRYGLALLRTLMREKSIRAEMVIDISNAMSQHADFDAALKSEAIRVPRGFEDLAWLFSGNWMNHRFARLDFDEAAYVYRLIRSLNRPLVAELGRFRGGTTVMLAAAGAHVRSLDLHPRHREWSAQLEHALEALELRHRVELVADDTRTHPPGREPYDAVIFDAAVTGDALRAEIENWWPAIAPGGHALFHDGRPKMPELSELSGEIAALEATGEATRMPDGEVPGSFVHLVKRAVH
jgi:protein-L-isoaspartate O-methyltransferase